MKFVYFMALIFAASLPVRSQTAISPASTPALPSDPRAFFELAVPHYDFSDPKLKPWHLKARYEIYSYDGNLATKGTYEYWWASPKVRRSTWDRPGMSRTDWITEDGSIYSKESGDHPLYFERRLEGLILYPGPNYEMIAAGKLKLGIRSPREGSASVSCLTATYEPEVVVTPRGSAKATPNIYCFDLGTMALLTTFTSSDYAQTQYSQFVKVQDHYIARHISVQIGQQKRLDVSVDVIEPFSSTAPVMIRAADSVQAPQKAHYASDSPAQEKPEGAKLIKKTTLVYPELAKAQHLQGVVLLAVMIGKDGSVRDPEVVASPSQLLTESAIDCVKQWKYEPYKFQGKPVEMETLIHVIFTFNFGR